MPNESEVQILFQTNVGTYQPRSQGLSLPALGGG